MTHTWRTEVFGGEKVSPFKPMEGLGGDGQMWRYALQTPDSVQCKDVFYFTVCCCSVRHTDQVSCSSLQV